MNHQKSQAKRGKTWHMYALNQWLIVDYHGTESLEFVLKLIKRWKANEEITSISLHKNGISVAQWIRK